MSNSTSSILTKSEISTLKAILAKVGGDTDTATKPAKKKARKTADRKPVVGGAVDGKRCLTAKNRLLFIADHDWATAGTSTRQLVEAVLLGEQPLTGDWAIGPRYAEKVTGEKAPVVAKATKKAKASKKAEPVVAAKPVVYRRANGTVAPKSEYTIRAALEGKGFTRAQVDKKTAKAIKLLG